MESDRSTSLIEGELSSLMRSAKACHRQGRLADARNLYRQILQKNPEHFDALHLLGVISLQSRCLSEAEELISNAIRVNPHVAEAYNHRGVVLRGLRRLEEAVVDYDRAIALKPDYAEVHNNRGNALRDLRRFGEALANYDKAIASKPNYTECHNNRGNALRDLQRLEEALASFDRAISSKPGNAEAHNNRGIVLRDLRRPEEALASFEKAIALKPDYAVACNNRGVVLRELKRPGEAIASYDRAIALKPDYAEVHNHRGNALRDLRRLEEALANYDRAIALKPDYAEAFANLGAALKELNRLDDALASFDRAIALKPDGVDAHLDKALVLLTIGDFAAGWRCYEWRKLKKEWPGGRRKWLQPVWLGAETLSGKRILVHWEQGLGDTIQFCRYVPLLEKAGAKVLFAPQTPLKSLMRGLGRSVKIIDVNDPGLAFDFHCPLLSLPLAFGTDLASIPGKTPYLHVEGSLVERWKKRMGEHGFKIGICWQGGVSKVDAGRSFPLSALYPLSQLPGVRLISLHKGAGEAQLGSLPGGMKVETLGVDFDAGPDSFRDSAAAMKCCDLVITSDSAIAHLAGALAVPLWIALKYVPEWRWMLERSHSPWYPTARLFRQRSLDDWAGVFSKIEKELASALKVGRAGRQSPSF